MPTGIVPPTGFVCFLPRQDVTFLDMSVEDAAKIIISGGMVTPDHQARLRELAARGGGKAPPEVAAAFEAARRRSAAGSREPMKRYELTRNAELG